MFTQLRNLTYLKKEIVFLFDLVLSLFSTIASSLLILTMFKLEGNEILAWQILGVSAIVSTGLILIFGFHKSIVRYFSIGDSLRILLFSLLKSSIIMVVMLALDYRDFVLYCGLVDFVFTAFLMIVVRVLLVTIYYYIIDFPKDQVQNSLIYSTRGKNPDFVKQLNRDIKSKYRAVGFLTTNLSKVGSKIVGHGVYSAKQSDEALLRLFDRLKATSVIFTSNQSFKDANSGIVDFCMRNRIPMYLVGELTAVDDKDGNSQKQIKLIQIEDLLDREEIKVDTDKIKTELSGKVVMITGAAGSIGSEISRQVAASGAKQLILFDIGETPMHDLQLEFAKKFPNVDAIFVLGDVRSKHRVSAVMSLYMPSIVFHAAAYKHVPMIESNPCEGVLTNVWGSVNVAQRSIECGVKKFVMISTDKAVNPTNVMGATKRIAEMCIQRMNSYAKTEFVTTRFGNVLGSNGSVIPLFKEQIANGGPVTVTHPDIIRYFMTILEACRLVLQAATMGHGGEILIFDMGKPEKIVDLAKKMIQLSGFVPDVDIKIVFTGLRPGEKLYEELLKQEENKQSTHEKIQIAQSVVVDEVDLDKSIVKLCVSARNVEVMETVKAMKKIVPEFKSKNSIYEVLDK